MSTEGESRVFDPIWVSPLGHFPDGLDVVVARSATHVAALWFALFESGNWEALSVEVLPATSVLDSGMRDSWISAWLLPRSELLASLPREHPLTQNEVRGIPLQTAFAYRAQRRFMGALDAAPTVSIEVAPGAPGLSRSDAARARMLQDAMDYTAARRYGVPPLELIAVRRNVSHAAAMQRVNRARKAGLLRAEKAGGLTDDAERLRRHLHYLTTGTRIIGKA